MTARSKIKGGLDKQILYTLRDGALSTPELADALGKANSYVYRGCCKLEDQNYLSSKLIKGKRLLYCVNCQKVVTDEIYEDCKSDKHVLRFFYGKKRKWELASAGRAYLLAKK